MKTLIRLLLEEQSDLGLHCLPRPVCPKTLDHYGNLLDKHDKISLFCRMKFQKKFQIFQGYQV